MKYYLFHADSEYMLSVFLRVSLDYNVEIISIFPTLHIKQSLTVVYKCDTNIGKIVDEF